MNAKEKKKANGREATTKMKRERERVHELRKERGRREARSKRCGMSGEGRVQERKRGRKRRRYQKKT